MAKNVGYPSHWFDPKWHERDLSPRLYLPELPQPTRHELFNQLTALKPEQKLERDQCLKLIQTFEEEIVRGRCNTTEDKDYIRWFYVGQGFDVGKCKNWDEAYEYAYKALRGHPASVGTDMIETSYKTEQRRRPLNMRYQRRRSG